MGWCRQGRSALPGHVGAGPRGPNRCKEAGVRVREVMSSPVEDGELVGITSEADLVPLGL
jgi:hypothetical protein